MSEPRQPLNRAQRRKYEREHEKMKGQPQPRPQQQPPDPCNIEIEFRDKTREVEKFNHCIYRVMAPQHTTACQFIISNMATGVEVVFPMDVIHRVEVEKSKVDIVQGLN